MRYRTARNVRGTSYRTCAHGSWLAHHRDESRSRRTRCAVLGCSNEVEVGAHVLLVNHTSWQEWIAPLCKGCNADTYDFRIKRDVTLVSANTRLIGCYMPYLARQEPGQSQEES